MKYCRTFDAISGDGRVGSMRIALGSDHAGYDLKVHLATTLRDWGHEVVDHGTDSAERSVDYPDFGAAVGRSVASGAADLGVCICGTGIGISIAANKVPGVRAATVHDVTSAHLAREHNHANVLCLGARLTGPVVAEEALRAWLDAAPGAGRHIERIEKINELDQLLVEHER
jgi:ribose 5-phosphate isomerase B